MKNMNYTYNTKTGCTIEGCTTATTAAIKSPLSARVYKRFANIGESM